MGATDTATETRLKEGTLKRSLIVVVLSGLFALTLGTSVAFAGSPHFVGAPTFTISGDQGETLTVHAKEAGLGDEAQIVVRLDATADCINNGGNHPKAVNKTSASTSAVVPVQNGKAVYDLSVTAVFSPSCSPPMTVQWTSATVTDETNNLTVKVI
jgi:hypothetical protein